MIVFDASAALCALSNAGAARRALASEQLHVPHLIDPEIANGVRRLVSGGRLSPSSGWSLLAVWRQLAVTRYATFPFLERVWELRENLSGYDASYVALAELLNCALVTADGRMSRAPGVRCPVTVVPG